VAGRDGEVVLFTVFNKIADSFGGLYFGDISFVNNNGTADADKHIFGEKVLQ
jgi:hypothetical protein